MQSFRFSSNLKIHPLHSYDMVVGMDWLESFSPMQVHWRRKWLSIPYGTSEAKLQGVLPQVISCAAVQLASLSVDSSVADAKALPDEVQQIVDQYSSLFSAPNSLPPSRSCDHRITLIPGAQSVSVRPYRYAPALKNEIERQVTEMLKSGLIQHSTRAFSSPVLLVKKKDGTYQFCVECSTLLLPKLSSQFL